MHLNNNIWHLQLIEAPKLKMEMLLFLSCSFDYDDDLSPNLIMLASLNFLIPWNIYTIYVNNLKIINYKKGKIHYLNAEFQRIAKEIRKPFSVINAKK